MKTRLYARWAPLAVLVFAIGCASSKASDAQDAGVEPADAMALPDALTGDGFGTECTEPSDCASRVCYDADDDGTGFCTDECEGICPDGYACKVVSVAEGTDRRLCVPADDNFCDMCNANADCGDTSDFCIALTGGNFCTIDCAGDPTICPTGFTCQQVGGVGDTVVGMQCMPVNGICCVDQDRDQRGQGSGCVTTDCDDNNDAVYDDAVEVCDGFDQDCTGGVDVGVTDCADANCQLGAFGYVERAGEPCESGTCTPQSATLCDLYTCSGGGENGDECATACDGEDNGKCVPTAHCDASTCLADLDNGQGADEDSDCKSNHEQNGFCCPAGDCCQMASDCPTFGTIAPICDNPPTCQGSRGEAVCTASFTCASTGMADDDSACTASTLANGCDWYADIYCNGNTTQSPPACPTSCSSDADCDAGGYCNSANQCVADQPDGGTCNESDGNGDAECESDHCQNGFCCGSGDCCSNETDCPAGYTFPPVCDTPSGCQGTRDVAQCSNFTCTTSLDTPDDSACGPGVLASDCGFYLPIYCDGNSVQTGPTCPSSCSSDAQCDANAYCNSAGACVGDQPDGGTCNGTDGMGGAECQSGHCQNGYCCASGDCCATHGDCDAYDIAPDCDDTATCQGTRTDGVCTGTKQCASQSVDDDSACAGSVANDCGPYPSVSCTNGQNQGTPTCPSTCMTDNDCDVSAHCDGTTCEPDLGQGGYCDEPSDCSSGLSCVDNVCCNSPCNGGCQACDLPGSVGTCTNVPSGDDPDNECGAVSCGSYYHGYSGDTCHRKADVGAATATCNGSGACRSAAQECTASGQGPAVNTCDSFCQDPTAGTCTGTTAGACTNVSQGNATCGLGVCQVTQPRCIAGVPNTCTPNTGAATTETCNNIDDNCDGTIDNGAFSDSYEGNNSCASVKSLPTVGSNQTQTVNTVTIYGSGDNDYWKIHATETDSSCSCCDTFCFDEDYQLRVTLRVPSGAGSYWFCTGSSCGGVNDNCQAVLAGQAATWTWTLDGACPGSDSYDRFFRIYGGNSPGYECLPYTLTYEFDPGCY